MLKHLFDLLVTIFIIVTLTFALMKLIPGDPFSDEKALPKEIHAALRKHYGLDDPWHQQYFNYLKAIATGDLGPSFRYQDRTVNHIIRDGFPVSAVLGLEALALALSIGITLGTIAALTQNQWQDNASMLFATMGISIPSFIIATLLQYVLALKLGLFPVARWGTFAQTVLPAISLAAMPTAFIARLTRANMIEVLKQDYIKTAKAKGLPRHLIVRRHVLRNSLAPLIPYLGQLTATILVGSFVVEKIFSIPGLGQWFVTSVSMRDYTVIMGMTIFFSVILIAALFLADIAHKRLDPRIKHED